MILQSCRAFLSTSSDQIHRDQDPKSHRLFRSRIEMGFEELKAEMPVLRSFLQSLFNGFFKEVLKRNHAADVTIACDCGYIRRHVSPVAAAFAADVQSAVVGRAIEGNEEVVAFVQLMQGTTTNSDELMAYVAPQLTSYKRPSEIVVLPALPATSTGKILKHKLAESLRGA